MWSVTCLTSNLYDKIIKKAIKISWDYHFMCLNLQSSNFKCQFRVETPIYATNEGQILIKLSKFDPVCKSSLKWLPFQHLNRLKFDFDFNV
jgi:hypothetical protein